MDELIGRLVAKIGVDRTAAAKAVGVILQFPHRNAKQAHAFITRTPRADGVVRTAQTDSNLAGMFATLGDVIGAGSRMMAAGMGMVQAVVREILRYAREKAGKNAVGAIAGATPGFGQFV